jgi:hypothetical protein
VYKEKKKRRKRKIKASKRLPRARYGVVVAIYHQAYNRLAQIV